MKRARVASELTFRLFPLRFYFSAQGTIRFPPAVPANLLRGALGSGLRWSDPGTYARLFAPQFSGGPSGFRNSPRPIVFRAAHLQQASITTGEDFFFDVHLFDTKRRGLLAKLSKAFETIGAQGLGPERARAELTETAVLDAEGQPVSRIWSEGENEAQPVYLSLSPGREPVRRIRVRFVTATELKESGALAETPSFALLACRVRDRISALLSLYGDEPPVMDYRAFAERAACVSMTRCEVQRIDAERRSSRTGQVHPLGGFTGVAEYEGELTELLPWLRVAQWTGVGRQTAWGKGQIQVEPLC